VQGTADGAREGDDLCALGEGKRHSGVMWRGRGALPWLFGVFALAGSARAEVDDATRASARQLGYSGVEAFQSGDYPNAHAKLDKAYRVLKVPSLGLWSARALERLGKLVEASERYFEVTRISAAGGQEAVQAQAQADARREVEALSARIPALRVVVRGAPAPDLVLTIDGVAVAPELVGEERPVNPGPHRIEAKAGGETAMTETSLGEGEHKTVTLSFGAAPATTGPTPPPSQEHATESSSGSPLRTLGWVAVIAGGAGVVVGGVTGGLALGKRGELDSSDRCRLEQNQCLTDMESSVEEYDRWRTVSTVGFVAGGVLATAGVVLLLTTPSEGGTRAGLRLSPGAVSLVGNF
jgi:hypothetical protein